MYSGYLSTKVLQDVRVSAYKREQEQHKRQGGHGYKASKREYSLTERGMDKVIELVKIRRKVSESGGKGYDLSYRLEGEESMRIDGVVGKLAKKVAKSGAEIDEDGMGTCDDDVPMDRYTAQGWAKYLESERKNGL